MPAPGEPIPLPNPRRPRPRAGEVLSLPTAPSAGGEREDELPPPPEPAPEGSVVASREIPEVRRRRRQREPNRPGRPRQPLRLSPVVLFVVMLLAMAAGAGLTWLLGWARPAAVSRDPGNAASPALLPDPTPTAGPAAPADTAEEIEAAYAAMEAGRPLEARDRFLAAAAKADPGTRAASPLRAAAAWCELAVGRTEAAEGLLVAGLSRANGGESADTRFLLGVSRLLRGDFTEAEKSFSRAAALDPTRADIHLLWGDTLRREGRAREAVAHLRAALRRNRQETNVGFYQLKLWLGQLQSGGDDATEAQTGIAAALSARSLPLGTVVLGAAARAVAAGNWAEAADLLRRARQSTEPAIFTASLQDPFFAEQAARPEFAEFLSSPR